jgi:hypothetical protein
VWSRLWARLAAEVSHGDTQGSEKRKANARGWCLHAEARSGRTLMMLVSFAQAMFPDKALADIGGWPAADGELVVSMRGGGAITSD